MCLKSPFFPDSSKVPLVIPVFKNVRELSTDKNYFPVSLLSVVNKVFEKLVNNKIVDHLEKFGQYGFRSSQSTADLLTVVSDRIGRTFNSSGATLAEALDKPKIMNKSFPSNRRLRVVLDGGKSPQEYSVNASKATFLVQYLSHFTLMTFLMMLL